METSTIEVDEATKKGNGKVKGNGKPPKTADRIKEVGAIVFQLPKLEIEEAMFEVLGLSGYLSHAWDIKAINQIERKQQGMPDEERAPRVPREEYIASMNTIDPKNHAKLDPPLTATDAQIAKMTHGIPTISFCKAAVNACSTLPGVAKTHIRQLIAPIEEFCVLVGEPTFRMDMVRLKNGDMTPRYRACFYEWSAVLRLNYRPKSMNIAQLVNLLDFAGSCVGVGEWRPEKGGAFGRFRIGRILSQKRA